MIFATVGTHEDPFDRLVGALDTLVETGVLTEPVVIQTGYSRVQPRRCEAHALLPYDRVQELMRAARIVVTHGGPASIVQVFAHGKVPVVVPRQRRFGEHVDDHQVLFSRRVADRVLVVLDIAELGPTLTEYDRRVAGLRGGDVGPERARRFATRLDALCGELVGARAKEGGT